MNKHHWFFQWFLQSSWRVDSVAKSSAPSLSPPLCCSSSLCVAQMGGVQAYLLTSQFPKVHLWLPGRTDRLVERKQLPVKLFIGADKVKKKNSGCRRALCLYHHGTTNPTPLLGLFLVFLVRTKRKERDSNAYLVQYHLWEHGGCAALRL